MVRMQNLLAQSPSGVSLSLQLDLKRPNVGFSFTALLRTANPGDNIQESC